MARSITAFTLFLAGVAVLFFVRCGGPHPVVRDVELARTGAGWIVSAEIVNTRRGAGQIQVLLRLRDPHGVVREEDQRVELAAHDRIRVSAAFDAPEGDYAAEVVARYPPL